MARIRHLLGCAAAVVGLAGGSLVAPFTVAPAEAASKPAYSIKKVKKRFTTNLQSYTYIYTKPVVTGIKLSVKASIDKQVDKFFRRAITERIKGDRDCEEPSDAWPALQPSGRTKGGLYQGRYLSVFLHWDATGCGDHMGLMDSKSLNVDVKTGKPMKLSHFAEMESLGYAVGVAIAGKGAYPNEPCWTGFGCPDRWNGAADPRRPDLASWKHPHGWIVEKAGVTVYYRWEDWIDSYPVKWASIVKPGVKVKTSTSRNVKTNYGCTVSVVQKGTLVSIKNGSMQWKGVRPQGSPAAKLFLLANGTRGTHYLPGYSVTYKSKNSSRATLASIWEWDAPRSEGPC